MKTIKTFDFAVTTREELWMKVYNAALEVGFSEEKAKEQTDKTVEEIFNRIGPEMEAQLRQQMIGKDRLRPMPIPRKTRTFN